MPLGPRFRKAGWSNIVTELYFNKANLIYLPLLLSETHILNCADE